MRMFRRLLIALLVFPLALSSSAFAQGRHVVDPSALSQTLSNQVSSEDASRAAIHAVLNRAEVREVAATAGFDLDRLNASVDLLSGQALDQAAAGAQQVNRSLVGGASTVVISTTTIIIALLLVIVLLVAVD